MKPKTIKAVAAFSEFLTYYITPDEFREIMHRASTLEDNTRDREIMSALARELDKALSA